jgi:hypothetical protein
MNQEGSTAMFCSECGKKAQGKFCSHCGSALAVADRVESHEPETEEVELQFFEEEPSIDWETEVRYDRLMRDKTVRAVVERNARRAKKGMTGEEYLALFDKVVPLGVPLEKVATIIQPLYAKWGVGMKKERVQDVEAPVGKVIVRALCSLARNGQKVRSVEQASDRCVIETVLPSDLFAFEAEVRLTVQRGRKKAHVAVDVHLAGQYFDWGKSRRYLDRFFDDLQRDAA